MKYTYPMIFTKEDEGYSVRAHDIKGVNTQGDTLQDALEMANDALCLILHDLERKGEELPAPSDFATIKTGENEFVQFVTCDTEFYERFFESKSVRKNVTIPSWLDYAAMKMGLSYSVVLQEALKKRLHYN